MTASDPVQNSLDIAIVSYNTCRDLVACLASIMANPPARPFTLTVVDNDSRDNSVEEVGRRFPSVRIIEAGGNLGYGRANNLALLGAPGAYYAILNSDTIMRPGSLDACCDYLNRHRSVGIVGGALLDPDGSPQMNWAAGELTVASIAYEQYFLAKLFPRSARFGAYFRTDWRRTDTRELPQVCGAFMVVRADLYNELGGFDESYFMYCEDTDLCRRAREAGYSCAYLHTAPAIHGHGKSSTGSVRHLMVTEHNRSRYHYLMMSQGRDAATKARAIMARGARLRIALWSAAGILRPSMRLKADAYREVLRGTLALGTGIVETDDL